MCCNQLRRGGDGGPDPTTTTELIEERKQESQEIIRYTLTWWHDTLRLHKLLSSLAFSAQFHPPKSVVDIRGESLQDKSPTFTTQHFKAPFKPFCPINLVSQSDSEHVSHTPPPRPGLVITMQHRHR